MPQRVLRHLEELRSLTANENGAQRVAWTSTWQAAREWFAIKLAELPHLVDHHFDVAGNRWVTLPDKSPRALVLGSHLDHLPLHRPLVLHVDRGLPPRLSM